MIHHVNFHRGISHHNQKTTEYIRNLQQEYQCNSLTKVNSYVLQFTFSHGFCWPIFFIARVGFLDCVMLCGVSVRRVLHPQKFADWNKHDNHCLPPSIQFCTSPVQKIYTPCNQLYKKVLSKLVKTNPLNKSLLFHVIVVLNRTFCTSSDMSAIFHCLVLRGSCDAFVTCHRLSESTFNFGSSPSHQSVPSQLGWRVRSRHFWSE